MTLVIDASVAAALVFEDERATELVAIEERLMSEGAVVPVIFRLEIANVLVQAERRGRIDAASVSHSLHLLGRLSIETDLQSDERAWRETLLLARSEALTSYDASYLELAQRRGADLATLDSDLRKAASGLGVRTLP